MLQRLTIKNYAIIEHLILEPHPQLSILTGETGAGKSIILGALGLILGERADSSVLINKEEKCVVEAHFDVARNEAFQKALLEADLDEDSVCIVRREIAVNGKSRAFVNDTPVTLQVLNQLTSLLVDLHRQFDHLELEEGAFQLYFVDALADNLTLLKHYQHVYARYTAQQNAYKQLLLQKEHLQKEADYKQYLLDELLQHDFKENEIEEIEAQLKLYKASEKIRAVLQYGVTVLYEGDMPVLNELKKINQQLHSISDVMEQSKALQERLSSSVAELQDIADELSQLADTVHYDPEQIQIMQERMDIAYKLFKKHGFSTTAQLSELSYSLQEELEATLSLDDQIADASRELVQLEKELEEKAVALRNNRKQVIMPLSERITALLALVGMPDAQFMIQLQELERLQPTGKDSIRFMIDANKSGQLQPVHKAASGGEMSRIMLAVKSLIAKAVHLPTLIFDEVDTGISGEAARQVGQLLHTLGLNHQVICITHQPQVAAKGDVHFFVYKEENDARRIVTRVKTLSVQERVEAIARMIGGETLSDAALKNAGELLN